MRNIEDEEKYSFVVRDGDNPERNWRVSLKWLKQHLQLPDVKFYANVYQMEWKIPHLEKKIKFLRELHEPRIIGYFYFKIFQFIKDRSKKYHQSFILDRVKSFGLWEERIKAWDKLIEDGIIIDCKNSGWYKTGILTFKKIRIDEHIKRMG